MDGWCVCGVNWSREWGDGLGGYDVPGERTGGYG